jgi:hypothetical protein
MKSLLDKGFIGMDMPPLPDDLWKGIRLLPLTDYAFASTSSDTYATWSIPEEAPITTQGENRCNGIIRWYDPITGRWLSNDPIGISGGLNMYVFVNNNPINFRDPDGLNPIYTGAGLAAAGIGGLTQAAFDLECALYLNQDAIRQEINSNNQTIQRLQDIVASGGKKDWPSGAKDIGSMGQTYNNDKCPDRQAVRNEFENLRNLRGWPSGADEAQARLRTGAISGLPSGMSAADRLTLANALLQRQQSYQAFLQRLYW